MANQEEIDEARKRLESLFDAQGDCKSCGWHACLYEHDVTDSDIAEALDDYNGELELYCKNYEYDDPIGHRGAKINIGIPRKLDCN